MDEKKKKNLVFKHFITVHIYHELRGIRSLDMHSDTFDLSEFLVELKL